MMAQKSGMESKKDRNKNGREGEDRPVKDMPVLHLFFAVVVVLGVPLLASLVMALLGAVQAGNFDEFFYDIVTYWITAVALGAIGLGYYMYKERRKEKRTQEAQKKQEIQRAEEVSQVTKCEIRQDDESAYAAGLGKEAESENANKTKEKKGKSAGKSSFHLILSLIFILGVPLLASVVMVRCGIIPMGTFRSYLRDVAPYWLATLALGITGVGYFMYRDRRRGKKK